jgi:hypothetical protein
MVDYRVGMILKNRARKPEAIMVITHLYWREYKDGERALRVVGLENSVDDYEEPRTETRPHGTPTPGIDGADLLDLDARSVERMYPYVMFDPFVPDTEDSK